MGLTTPVAQPGPILRTKLRKVVIKCKNVMRFKFQAPFLKMYIFEVATFSLVLC